SALGHPVLHENSSRRFFNLIELKRSARSNPGPYGELRRGTAREIEVSAPFMRGCIDRIINSGSRRKCRTFPNGEILEIRSHVRKEIESFWRLPRGLNDMGLTARREPEKTTVIIHSIGVRGHRAL